MNFPSQAKIITWSSSCLDELPTRGCVLRFFFFFFLFMHVPVGAFRVRGIRNETTAKKKKIMNGTGLPVEYFH